MPHRLRVVPFFVVVLCVAVGVAFVGLRGSPVTILTGYVDGGTETSIHGCYLSFIVGALVTDPTYGTAVIDHDPTGHNPDHRYPVMWPPGDTGRTSGFEVEILDRTGSVIARTGQAWWIPGGFWGGSETTPRFWAACGYVLPPDGVE